MNNEIIFISKEKLDEYNTKLLLRFVEYLNNQHKKSHSVFYCGARVQIIDEENLIKDFLDKVSLQ